MTVTFTWKGEEFKRAVLPVFTLALGAAAQEGADLAGNMIVPRAAPGYEGRTGAGGGGVSTPGQSPTTQTKALRESIHATAVRNLTSRIGTNLKYGLWLEFGVRSINLAARPWLRPSVLSNRGRRRMQARFTKRAIFEFRRIAL